MAVELLRLDETTSTNLWLKQHDYKNDVVVWTDYQTAGRGCGSNKWESERAQNLLFSMLYHPTNLPANQQFRISQAVSLAIVDVLNHEGLHDITIKWPNDIYWKDRKLAGILIENRLQGSLLLSSIIGIGLNVNQEHFVSDAPNPISLWQITGKTFNREHLLRQLVNAMEIRLSSVGNLMEEYQQALYRQTGIHPYRDCQGDFMAAIENIDPDGRLVLRDADGQRRTYGFKEVEFIVHSL